MLLWMLLGCRPPSTMLPPSPPVVVLGEPLEEVVFLEGFDLVWRRHPHRLRRLVVGASVADGSAPAQLRAWVQGGTWASGERGLDTPDMTVSYAMLQASGVVALPARVTLSLRGRAKGRDARDIIPEATAVVSLPCPPGSDASALVPWLTGLDISTLPSHEVGYTLHGLDVSLGEPAVAGDRIQVPVTARFEAAPVLERPQRLIAYASTIVVDLVVLVAPQGGAERVHGDLLLRRGSMPLVSPRRGAPARVPLSASLHDTTRSAVAGLSGFSIEVDRDGASAGRYLRALTVGLRDSRVDLSRGAWSADGELRLSNAGDLARALRVRGSITSTLLQLPIPVQVARGRFVPEAGRGCVGYPDLAEQPCPLDPGALAAP